MDCSTAEVLPVFRGWNEDEAGALFWNDRGDERRSEDGEPAMKARQQSLSIESLFFRKFMIVLHYLHSICAAAAV